mgnify:CR=1 FL=1
MTPSVHRNCFSQGQWQLLSIARAAVARPKLLLLDEITANLDAETEKEVLEALKRVSENRTVISISHRVSAKWEESFRLSRNYRNKSGFYNRRKYVILNTINFQRRYEL